MPRANACPSLKKLLFKVAREIEAPADGTEGRAAATPGESLYDLWLRLNPSKSHAQEPHVGTIGGGSDFMPFLQSLGIPSTDLRYDYQRMVKSGGGDGELFEISSYPVYHSLHDGMEWMEAFGDPTFARHASIVRFWGKVAVELSGRAVLPFAYEDYAAALGDYVAALTSTHDEFLNSNLISTAALADAVKEFSATADKLRAQLDAVGKGSTDEKGALHLRQLNNRLMWTERALLAPEGLPGRPHLKHVIYAPALYDSYASSALAGINDAIFAADAELVKRQISVAALTISRAAGILGGTMF